MKTKYHFILILTLSVQGIVKGQTGDTRIGDLQIPVSPGFVLADQTPSSINRPTNPKGLVASILSLNRGGAVEVTPYWLTPTKYKANLTFARYVANKTPIFQTFSLSATSFKSEKGSYLSVGGKFHLVRIFDAAEVSNKQAILVGLLAVQPALLDLDAIQKARDDLGRIRPKFIIEIAGAWLGYSPLNSFDDLSQARTGIWANVLYKPIQLINITVLSRYINNKKKEGFSDRADFFDFGASLGLENSINFSLNAEYVYRNDFANNKTTHRLAAVANYKIAESIYITGSFGKNFDQNENLFAIFGINVGLNNQAISIP